MQLRRDDLLRVTAPFEEASPLPREAFTDPHVFEVERRAIFGKSWLPVAHEADLERPGDWVRAPILGAEVVVVRSADLTLTALHAVCRHRGMSLLEGDSGHFETLSIVCPYHDWAYRTDGGNLRAPGAREPLPDLSLKKARVGVYAGVVFVNLAMTGPPLDELLALSGPPWLARARLSSLRRARRTDVEVAANWKVCVANFQESHHFPQVHPSLDARTPWGKSSSVIESEHWLGGLMDLAPPFETVSETGLRRDRPFIAAPEDRARISDAFVWPLWLTSLQPDYLLTYRLSPLAVDRTLIVFEIHTHASVIQTDLSELFTFWERTNAEDRAICERQQKGLFSSYAGPFVYAQSEDGLHAFERLVAEHYLSNLDSGVVGDTNE